LFFCNFGHCLWSSNVLASSAQVLTRNCVNFEEQNRILGCTRGPPEICFQDSDFCHGTTTLFYLFLTIRNLFFILLIFPTIWKQSIYLIIFGNINFVIFLCIMSVRIVWKESLDTFIKWMVKNVMGESSNESSSNLR